MIWHISRQHEAPQVVDAIQQNYAEKLDLTRLENLQKERQICDITFYRDEATLRLIHSEAHVARLCEMYAELRTQNDELAKELKKAIYAIAARDEIMRQKLGYTLPNPFGEIE